MALTFELDATAERLRSDLRDWGLRLVRPREREVERTGTFPSDTDAILEACPVQLGALAIAELRSEAAGYDKEFVASFGDEGSNVLAAVLAEEMSYSGAWAANLLHTGGTGSKVIQFLGTPEQIDRWVTGKKLRGAFALTEPHTGSDTSNLATTATRDGDEWIINGSKMYCTNGAKADFALVFATIDKTLGREGIRAFVVEKGTPGFDIVKENEDKLGLRHTQTSELRFEGARVPLDHCLGGPDMAPGKNGIFGALSTLSTSRPIFAAHSVGIGRAAIDVARVWTHQNRSEFTSRRWERVQAEIQRLTAGLDEARWLVLAAAWARDEGRDNRVAASMAKAHAPVAAEAACRRALQIMGDQGCSERYLIEKWYRDIKVYDIFEGSGQIQRITVSRRLLGSGASRG